MVGDTIAVSDAMCKMALDAVLMGECDGTTISESKWDIL